MKIELSRDEMDYLADKTFWDWKRAELDVWSIKMFDNIPKRRAKQIISEEQWYKNLYHKLGGEIE